MCHLGGFQARTRSPGWRASSTTTSCKQLRDFKARKRTNDAGNMTSVSQTLSEADIENLAHYLASLR